MRTSRQSQYLAWSIALVFVACSDDSDTPSQPSKPAAPSFVLAWGTQGSGDGQFDRPEMIACDPDGNIYVVDYENYRIQKYNGEGAFLLKWGSRGSGDGQFEGAEGIACDANGNIYVSDWARYRIQKFR